MYDIYTRIVSGRGVARVGKTRCSHLRLSLAMVALSVFIMAISGVAVLASGIDSVMMGVDELRPGMKGYGLTVFSGVKPGMFEVEILMVPPVGSSPGSSILVRASGREIEQAGGVAEGMSGSPVYIDGRLIGAIAYVFPGSDHFIAGVTPIADMLRSLDYGPMPQGAAAASTLYVSGASPRVMQRLTELMGSRGLAVKPAAASSGKAGNASGYSYQLEPGSMVALQLARGDVEMSIFGSVTYVDGRTFLAFGHPVMSTGAIELPAAGAQVHAIVRSDKVPFKMSSSMGEIGMFVQDRLYSVAGLAGEKAGMTPIRISVLDQDTGKRTQTAAEIASSELFISEAFGNVAMTGTDQGINRVGAGTSKVEYTIEIEGHEPLKRSDMVWSGSDISAASVRQAHSAVQLIAANAVEQARIASVKMDVSVGSLRDTARIESARPLVSQVAPGDTLDVEVTLRVYRGERITKVVQIDVPEDVPEGTLSFMVRGGGVSPDDDLGMSDDDIERLLYVGIDELVAELESAPAGNEIVLQMEEYLFDELYSDEADTSSDEDRVLVDSQQAVNSENQASERHIKDEGAEALLADKNPLPSARLKTEWFIQGFTWIDVQAVSGR